VPKVNVSLRSVTFKPSKAVILLFLKIDRA
jgi:hypothetical protein